METQTQTPTSAATPREPLAVQEQPSDEYAGRAQLLLLELYATHRHMLRMVRESEQQETGESETAYA